MTPNDRAQFTAALTGLGSTVDAITYVATNAGTDGSRPAAQLTAQLGNVAKAVLLLTNFLLESQPALLAALASAGAPAADWQRFGPPPEQCSFCTRPATDLPTADWPMCTHCYNEFGAFDPVLDGAALEVAESLTQ